ncbi:MAG: 5'-3' exonuclease H3TH domain-containing protein, partial [candidate division WOR-3 bacterium]
MKTLLLVDGHSLIYRSFFAFIRNPLRNSKGFNTSAIFGFAQTLRKLLAELKPELVAVVFDAPGRTFRHEKYEQYKIERPPAPEELPPQIPIIKEMVRAWGLAVFEKPNTEADDVLGTLACRFADQGFDVTIATSDKDLLQLVGGRITVYDPWKEKRFTAEDVKEKLGVAPAQVPDFLGLSGDASDSIPGVPGVGPKRALDILMKYGSLERAIEFDKRVTPHAELARLSKELATIDTGVELEADEQVLVPGKGDARKLHDIFRAMDFRDLLAEAEPEPAEAVVVGTFLGVDELRRRGRFALEFSPGTGLWVFDGAKTVLVPITDQEAIRQLLEDKALLKIGHRLKDQAKALRSTGVDISLPLFDVEIGAWLLDPNRKRFDLEDVVMQILGRNVRLVADQVRPAQVWAVYEQMVPQIQALGLEPVAEQLDMPLVPVLAHMEERGI